VTGFFYVSAPMFLPVREIILLKDQFVIPPTEPYSKGIRNRHADKSTRFRSLVHIYFLFIFKPCLARIMPAVNKRMLTQAQARPAPSHFGPCNAILRQSQ
jgi:hypothetical protein